MRLRRIYILFVDDKLEEEGECFSFLKQSCAGVYVAHTYAEAMDFFHKSFVNIVIVNTDIKSFDGETVLHSIRKLNRDTQIVAIAREDDPVFMKEAINLGIDGYMNKPMRLPDLKDVLERCLEVVLNPISGFYSKDRLGDYLKLFDYGAMVLVSIDNLDHYSSAYGIDFEQELVQQTAIFLDQFKPDGTKIWQVASGLFVITGEALKLEAAKEFATMLNVLVGEQKIQVNLVDVNVTFTLGIAEGETEDLYSMADFALQDAQKFGRKCYHVYEEKSSIESIQKTNLMWMNRVKVALEAGMIQPWYQPIFNNITRKVEKYECLARLEEPTETISPIDFLEPARLVGLMPNISFAIINNSFAKFKTLDLDFSINLSVDDLKSDTFVNYILNRCDRYGINPDRVVIEVLESVGMSGNYHMTERIKELKRNGFQIAIDDFGTMNSNFSRLYEIEADFIKIDGCFVRDIDSNIKSYSIVKSISRFAKSIGAYTIAEFVHNESVQRIIEELEIDYSQGAFIGMPSRELL